MDNATSARIQALWDELPTFGVARTDEAMLHALKELSAAVDAQQAYWMGAVRVSASAAGDPANGWRPRTLRHLVPLPDAATLKTHARRIEAGRVDETILANLRHTGRFRININHRMVSAEWYRSEFYKTFYEPLNVQDFIFVATPLGEDVESWFGFLRIAPIPSLFDERSRAILDYAVRPLRWFHRQLALHYGLVAASDPLTPAERRVLNGLLSERTEREIAEESNLSPATVHTYCTRICRKFNVRGRAGLTALWLGQLPAE